jgi:uncharacterized protein
LRPSEALALHRDQVRMIIANYPLSSPRLFGSTARNEDREDSDLDIIVAHAGGLTYFDLARLEDELTNLLKVKVDVRTEGEFSSRILSRIQRDFVPL